MEHAIPIPLGAVHKKLNLCFSNFSHSSHSTPGPGLGHIPQACSPGVTQSVVFGSRWMKVPRCPFVSRREGPSVAPGTFGHQASTETRIPLNCSA